jgi:SAM-dependent methyltransferase
MTEEGPELAPAEANRRFYAIHASEYDEIERCANDDAPQRQLAAMLERATAELGTDARVLDAGGGSGNASLMLSRRGFRPLVVDVSPDMVALWERKARAAGFEPASEIMPLEDFFAADERTWDLVVFSSVLHHLQDPVALLRAAADRVAPGGFVVTVFDPLRLSPAGFWLLRRLDYICWVLVKSPQRVPGLVKKRLSGDRGTEGDDFGAIAEFHAMSGLRDDELVGALLNGGLEVLQHERLYDARFSAFRWLARRLRMPTAFSLVARRPRRDQTSA